MANPWRLLFPRGLRWPVASLRAYLVLAMLVATVPLAAFALYLLHQEALHARAQVRAVIERSANSFALLVERELTTATDVLTGLAYTEALQRGDVAAFQQLIARASPLRPGWRGVYLAQPEGAMVFASDTSRQTPPGRVSDEGALARLQATLQPTVTDLVTTDQREAVTDVLVPVLVQGQWRYVIGARIPAAHWRQLSERAGVVDGSSLALMDGRARLITRYPQEPDAVSRPLASAEQAVQRPVSSSGWSVRAELPAMSLLGDDKLPLAQLVIAGAFSVVLGLALALAVARRVSAPLGQLAHGGAAAVRDPVVVKEIAVLRSALEGLERQSETLMRSERDARRSAEAANQGKDVFLAMLGHELRNPLGAIGAAIEVLHRAQDKPDVAASARGVIERQTRQMGQLLNDLQDVARVGAGKLKLQRRQLELAHHAWRPLDALRVAGRLRHHAITLDLQPVWVDADPVRIEQILVNLLTNALKYTPAGGHVELTVRQDGESALVQVRDTGVGISPELLAQVFDIFVQSERTADRRQGGMGLGLTLVRRLVELHGGSVSAASDGADRGSTLTLRLPAQPVTPEPLYVGPQPRSTAAAPQGGQQLSSERPGDSCSPLRGHHGAVLGFEAARPCELEAVLCGAGCRVTSSLDIDTGLDALGAQPLDFVLVDAASPNATRVRERGIAAPIIGLGNGPGIDCDAVLPQPLDLQLLRQQLALRKADAATT